MGFNEYEDEHILNICGCKVDDFVGSHPEGYDLEIKEVLDSLVDKNKQLIWQEV